MKRQFKNNIFLQPVKVENYQKLFTALGKAVLHGVKKDFGQVFIDLMDAGSAFGLDETEERLTWQLVNRSLMQAMESLIESNRNSFPGMDEEDFYGRMKKLDYNRELVFDLDFLRYPKECQFVKDMQEVLSEWLSLAGVADPEAAAIMRRFPSFFVYALRDEWAQNTELYRRLLADTITPFSSHAAIEDDWESYRAWLDKQTQESIFDEAFALSQIYVPLNAYYEVAEKNADRDISLSRVDRGRTRIVVELALIMQTWLDKRDKEDCVRIISGGPGSGKSTFAKMFAAALAEEGRDVLFIPLHKLDLRGDLKDTIGEFLTANRIFQENPIGKSEQLLLIFDGLDEIMQQGKVSQDAARDFIRQVQRLLLNHNSGEKLQLRVLVTGRDLPVQTIKADYRKEGQVLHVLPYYVGKEAIARDNYRDAARLLQVDKRDIWWGQYGKLTGQAYNKLPDNLRGKELEDISAEPLLNYLLALSYARGTTQFTDGITLNALYSDLVNAVYARGWQSRHRALPDISASEFEMVLGEIAVSAWQGNGRTTTLAAIEKRCKSNQRLQAVLAKFQNAAQEGYINLLTAFYFRSSGIQGNEATFEFTHKSFGEYLSARKIIAQLQKMQQALAQNEEHGIGWTKEYALEQWILLCGKVPIDSDVYRFLCNEMYRQGFEAVAGWQAMLCDLIAYMLANGMPFEKLSDRPKFLDETRQSIYSETTLLAALSACSRCTKEISKISWPSPTSAGEWLSRLNAHTQIFSFSARALSCYLDLSRCFLVTRDMVHANLTNAKLQCSVLQLANLQGANLREANLREANLREADLHEADLHEADLHEANLREANLRGANLRGADLWRADLWRANLRDANLQYVRNIERAVDLQYADLKGAIFDPELRKKLIEMGIELD